MYAPIGKPFYYGDTWSSIFVIPLLMVVTFIWSRTKRWPMKLIRQTLQDISESINNNAAMHLEHSSDILKSLETLREQNDDIRARLDRHDSEFEALEAKLGAQVPASPES